MFCMHVKYMEHFKKHLHHKIKNIAFQKNILHGGKLYFTEELHFLRQNMSEKKVPTNDKLEL